MISSLRMSVFAVATCTLLSACASQQGASGGTMPPGAKLAFTISDIDDKKWTPVTQQVSPNGSVRVGFACKVLHCPEPANVFVSYAAWNRPQPTKQELEKLSKDVLPKLIEARNLELQVQTNNLGKIERLSSAPTKIAGYDAVLHETKTTIGDRSRVQSAAMIFPGKAMVTINAEAGDRATARRSIDEFATRFKVEEGSQP